MGGIQRQLFHQPCSVPLFQDFHEELENYWVSKEGCGDHYNDLSLTSSLEESSISSGSISTLDLLDGACLSTSNPSSQSNGSLDDFKELILAQLPIKRGLSKFYEGQSQSFSCLSNVKSIKDLPKKKNSYNKWLNASKSYGGGLDTHKSFKKPSKSSITFLQVRRATNLDACSSLSIPLFDL